MPSDPSSPEHAVIELRGELAITDAAALGAALSAAVSREPAIECDLTPRHPQGPGALPFWTMTWVV